MDENFKIWYQHIEEEKLIFKLTEYGKYMTLTVKEEMNATFYILEI